MSAIHNDQGNPSTLAPTLAPTGAHSASRARVPSAACKPRHRSDGDEPDRRSGWCSSHQDRAERDPVTHSPGGSDADPPPARQSRIGAPHPTPLRAETSIAFDLRSTRCWLDPRSTANLRYLSGAPCLRRGATWRRRRRRRRGLTSPDTGKARPSRVRSTLADHRGP